MIDEKQMRRALLGRKAQRIERCHVIHTVVVSARPPDNIGHNVILEVPVNTISRFEAYTQAMSSARSLLNQVILEYRSHD